MKTILSILKKAGGWRPNLYIRMDDQKVALHPADSSKA